MHGETVKKKEMYNYVLFMW